MSEYIGKLVFNLNDVQNKNALSAAYFDFSKDIVIEVSVYGELEYCIDEILPLDWKSLNEFEFYDHRYDRYLRVMDFFTIYRIFPTVNDQFNNLLKVVRRENRLRKLLRKTL